MNYKLKSDIGEDSDTDILMGEVKTKLTEAELAKVDNILQSAPIRHLMQFEAAG